MQGRARPQADRCRAWSSRCLRLPAQTLRQDDPQCGTLRALLGRYAGALVLQIAQHAVCSQFHRLEGRLGCWLLMTYDRAPAEAWWLTQHFLATLLGVRRASVTNHTRFPTVIVARLALSFTTQRDCVGDSVGWNHPAEPPAHTFDERE